MAQTELQKAYAKQVKRIRQFIRRAEQRGYQFTQNIIPKKPKTIKPESVEKLRKITPEKMYRKSVYSGEATYGEIVKGTKGREAERKARSIKSAQTRRERRQVPQAPMPDTSYSVPDKVNTDKLSFSYTVIHNYRGMIKTFPKVAYPILSQWLDSLIAQYGEWETALMLDEGLRNGLVLTKEIAYDENKLQDYMADMENYLGLDTERRKQLTDALESDENFTVY